MRAHLGFFFLGGAVALLAPTSGCGDDKQGGEGASAGESSATGAGDPSGSSTSGTSTSSGSSTVATETASGEEPEEEEDDCWWWTEEAKGFTFCPPAPEGSAAVAGMTPYGPVYFPYARFGLMWCSFCPNAWSGSLLLYDDPELDLKKPSGDYMIFRWLHSGGGSAWEGQIGGEKLKRSVKGEGWMLDLPDYEYTQPPLDPEAPPLVVGQIQIKNQIYTQTEEWTVSGLVKAPLCTKINFYPACE